MSDSYKFNTCKNRSKYGNGNIKQINACCTEVIQGYICYVVSSRNINPDICALCPYYEKKDNEEETEIKQDNSI